MRTLIPFHRPLLALVLATTWSCAAQVEPVDSISDEAPYDDDAIALDESQVASTTQALAVYHPINTLGNTTLNGSQGNPCRLQFQYGNIWAASYAKARISSGDGTCGFVVIELSSHDGTKWHSKQTFFNARGVWVDVTIPWSNVVGVRYSIAINGNSYFREFTPFPP